MHVGYNSIEMIGPAFGLAYWRLVLHTPIFAPAASLFFSIALMPSAELSILLCTQPSQ